MNLKEHIIEINDEKLYDWDLLNWDNPDPYDYRYYKMLGLALFERISNKNAFSLDRYRPGGYDRSRRVVLTFLEQNAYIIYSLRKNSILDFKLISSLYDAYLNVFTYFVNRDNLDSKFYKEYKEESFKTCYLNKSVFYTIDDLPKILNNKQLLYGASPETYKDFLIGMHQMALMMRWRVSSKFYCEYESGSTSRLYRIAYTYNEAFNRAYTSALSNLTESSRSPYVGFTIGSSTVQRFEEFQKPGNFLFSVMVTIYKNINIKFYQKIPYSSTVELYISKPNILTGGIDALGTTIDSLDPPYLTDSIILYDRKNVSENESIMFTIEDLDKEDYKIELPDYDKNDEFSISKSYSIDYLLIYDCNNSYKLKAN